MKNSLVLSAVSLLSASAFAVLPQVDPSTVSVAQDGLGSKVTVSYRLTNADGIVTVDIQTNALADATGVWASVGAGNLRTLVGDVNKLVAAADVTRTAVWFPDREEGLAGRTLGKVRAVVKAWSEKQPPDYLVIDLELPNVRRYYTCAEALPDGGLTNAVYRKSRLAMRRIPAAGATFRMGPTPEEKKEIKAGSDVPHPVSFTNDFYMGVFHLTQGQTYCVTNNSVQTTSAGWKSGDAYVLGIVTWANVRGDGSADSDYDWPTKGHAVDPNSVIGRLRTRTGVEFDLPTEAQWEFACRAGTTSFYNDGSYTTNTVPDLAVCRRKDGYFAGEVGTKKPNAWGLYDMHGLIYDLCLDWYAANTSTAPVVEPVGPTTGTSRVRRGGSFYQDETGVTSAERGEGSLNMSGYNSYRLIAPLSLKW